MFENKNISLTRERESDKDLKTFVKKSHRRGFTLIELLVVIAIIGILSSVVMASLGKARAKARDAKNVSTIKAIRTAMELYYDDNDKYPLQPASGDIFHGVLAATESATYRPNWSALRTALAPYLKVPEYPAGHTTTNNATSRFRYYITSDESFYLMTMVQNKSAATNCWRAIEDSYPGKGSIFLIANHSYFNSHTFEPNPC